jgi:hypothetical protein
MTIRLTPEQSALYEDKENPWASYRIEEDIIELLDRQNITEQVVVTLDTGAIVFAVYKGELA